MSVASAATSDTRSVIHCECYECGRPVELPDDTFQWDCVCGFSGQRTEVPQRALSVRFKDDPTIGSLLLDLLDADEIRDASSGEAERAAVAVVARRVDAIVADRARLAAARSRPRAPLPELVELTHDLDGRTAWRKLAALGRVPDDGKRKFWTEDGIAAHPDQLDICLAFASDVSAALAAEDHFRAFCAAIGLQAEVVWNFILGTGELYTLPVVGNALKRCVPRGVHDDCEALAIAAELYDVQPNPFVPLRDLYATGVAIDADSEGQITLWFPEGESEAE
jgi:hypothetical protein